MRPEITIRELQSGDRHAVAFAFAHLSAESRYQRYFTIKPDMTPRELTRLMSVDHWHHEALIAFSAPPRTPVGIARYVRLDDFDAAEVAIEVVDVAAPRGGHGADGQAKRASTRRGHPALPRVDASR